MAHSGPAFLTGLSLGTHRDQFSRKFSTLGESHKRATKKAKKASKAPNQRPDQYINNTWQSTICSLKKESKRPFMSQAFPASSRLWLSWTAGKKSFKDHHPHRSVTMAALANLLPIPRYWDLVKIRLFCWGREIWTQARPASRRWVQSLNFKPNAGFWDRLLKRSFWTSFQSAFH